MATDLTDMDRRDPTVASGSFSAITPDNSNDIRVSRGLYIGGAGNIRVTGERDNGTVDFVGVLAGTVLPIRVRRVHATGTTASSIVALY